MSFLDDISRVENAVRTALEIVQPAKTWRIATGTRDITIAGNKYTAEPSARTELGIPTPESGAVPMLVLPAKHAFVQAFMGGAAAPRFVPVNIYLTAGATPDTAMTSYEVIWRGRIASVAFDGTLAKFSLPSRLLSVLGRRLPQFSVGRTCGNQLFDANCQASDAQYPAGFSFTTTIVTVNGNKITHAGSPAPTSQWARGGKLLHVASGETMAITDQTGTVLTVQLPIGGLASGQSIRVYAGCDKSITTCRDKFDNRVHFNGYPQLNRETVPNPPGLGVYTSA